MRLQEGKGPDAWHRAGGGGQVGEGSGRVGIKIPVSPLAHLCNLTFLSSLTRTPPPATLTDSLYTETWKQYFLQFSSGPQTVSAKIT